jgi:hypothetical protein
VYCTGETQFNQIFSAYHVQLESGSTITTFAPYSNICPISGWDEVEVTRAGKNLLDASAFTTTTNKGVAFDLQSDGGIRVHGTATGNARVSVPISVKVFAGVAYTFGSVKNAGSVSGSNFNAGILGGTARTIGESIRSVTFTPSADQTYTEFAIFVATGTTVDNVIYPQLEIGSSATAYEPYTASTYEVTFPTPPGTVYGGSLDVISGVLTVTDANIASYAGETLPGTWISDRDVYAQGTTPTNGAQVVYKLAEPLTYQLDPVTITSLLKQNTIFADCGNTSAVYCADPKTYIDSAIASAVAALS